MQCQIPRLLLLDVDTQRVGVHNLDFRPDLLERDGRVLFLRSVYTASLGVPRSQ